MNPTVSVIIPVLNHCIHLQSTLTALASQTYPAHKVQVIIVDNGSEEDISGCIGDSKITLLFETEHKSPYAARNKGIAVSSGQIIAFTDANKTPEHNWIEEGVRAMIEMEAEIAGGDIIFSLNDNPTAAEVFDATFFNNNRNLVFNEQAAVTGNLFIRRELLNSVGLFRGEFRSGMDVWWTQSAVRMGHKLIYADKAIVECKPRKFWSLMKKSHRVGISHPFIRKEAGDSLINIVLTVLRTFLPPGLKWLSDTIAGRYGNTMKIRLWFTFWSYKWCLGIGRIQGLLLLKRMSRNSYNQKL